ncbi:hypothetical protein CO230_10855 [Chryseobacterium sp. 6424]|uniref:glycosyltransferase family 2 protein n=1 Tax=Chryseobacterium sp. 6424 TaxID=2039166 RepID=UPI000EFC0BCB|nr:glycosyltransferase family 2 protein [Chryseobacterium sp. 6424]AYO58568.1 hypothetical protein CO230_10855 [Chryseobacterium sp. 6424]
MELKPLITIIVPIYNTEQFLNHCIESIYLQTYKNWECLLIDDCSTDNSAKIAKEWCNTDARFKLLSTGTNSGVSRARNLAIRNANGDFVNFIDSDDWVGPTFLQDYLYHTPSKYKLVVQDLIKKFPNHIEERTQGYRNETFNLPLELQKVITDYKKTQGYVSNKLFNLLLIREKKLYFTDGVTNEDEIFFHNYLINVKEIVFLQTASYFYRQLPSSLSKRPQSEQFIRYLYHKKTFLDFIIKSDTVEKEYAIDYKNQKLSAILLHCLQLLWQSDENLNTKRILRKIYIIMRQNKLLQISFPKASSKNKILLILLKFKIFKTASLFLTLKKSL